MGMRYVGLEGKEDAWIWKASKNGDFSTKSAYATTKAAKPQNNSLKTSPETLKNVWETPATHKVKVMTWRLVRNRLPTCENLRKMNIQIDEVEAWCNACCSNLETCNHLFIECPKADAVWSRIQQWVGVSGPRPKDIVGHLETFANLGQKKHKKLLTTAWMCTVWLLWKNRNESRFDGKQWDIQSLCREVKVRLWCWIKIFKFCNVDASFDSWMSSRLIADVL
ncbi:uncharacterized protein LOC130993923 [Salvia miltiorrhiza]|uniref:uncharacterized protein LOC130993923 n=1 Tax=Salvia miltiorrhiza TaxID=226208 RepID=UPI0025ACEE0D|nr:uncharacterized protein LOC130993923 [Salvia miltiorrhiza]